MRSAASFRWRPLLSLIAPLLLSIPLLPVLPANAGAGTWHVPGDPGAATIQQALDNAAPGDSVVVACGVYNEADVRMKAGVTLRSATGDPACVTVDAQRNGRVLFCRNMDAATAIEGITFTAGSMGTRTWPDDLGGGVFCRAASPRFQRCVFYDNEGGYGGGMYCDEVSSPVLADCVFRQNSSLTSGGGLFCAHGSSPAVTGCTFSQNTADLSGGGLYAAYGSHPTLAGCTFSANTAPQGAAISAWNESSASVARALIVNHSGSPVFRGDLGSVPGLSCTDIADNPGGSWEIPIAGQRETAGNFTASARFCSSQPDADRWWALRSDSPCAPANNGCGVQVGAWAVGCGTTGLDLREFTVKASAEAVTVAWVLAAGAAGSADDFRVTGNTTGSQWDVPVTAGGGGRFSALDHPPATLTGAEVTYTLSRRGAQGEWQVLASQQVTLTNVPATVALLDPYPNPFNPRLTVPFALPRAQHARVSVHDLAGRRVAVLAEGTFPAGRHEARWNGQDTRGRPAAAGAYFFRLETAGTILIRRALLVR